VAILVPFADIACFEPSIRGYGFGSLLRVVVVAAHNVVSPDPDLALVVGSKVTCFREVYEFNIRAPWDAA
jgi:hypothetical protein